MYILISYICSLHQFVKPSILPPDSLKCVSVLAKKLNKVANKPELGVMLPEQLGEFFCNFSSTLALHFGCT